MLNDDAGRSRVCTRRLGEHIKDRVPHIVCIGNRAVDLIRAYVYLFSFAYVRIKLTAKTFFHFRYAELCDAVKKIQSTFRGKAFRKADAAAATVAVDVDDVAAVVAEAEPVPEAQTPSDELADIDLADPDLAKAASMIQSKFRVKRK